MSESFDSSPEGYDQVLIDENADGQTDVWVFDTNSDSIPDQVATDTDADGYGDQWVMDGDQNGIADGTAVDVNGDGTADIIGVDDNENGVLESFHVDTDGDGEYETTMTDTNENNVLDHEEESAPGAPGQDPPARESDPYADAPLDISDPSLAEDNKSDVWQPSVRRGG